MANAKKALNQQTRVDGGPIIKVHEFIENIAKLGAKTRCLQVPKIKPLSRMAYFRATNEQQKAHELKMKQSGTKPEYMFGAYLVNQTSYEYALFLEAKQAKAAALEVVLKIEQPAKPLPPPPATTCNPEAARLRAKATICRQAKRPAWAKILEDKADALDRVDPPEPPPCKHKNKMQRQRPRKTACILLAKIHHPVRQKYGEPFRQNFSDRLAERLTSNIHEPPGIKTNTPLAHFDQPNPSPNPCPAHNLNPATHQPPRSKSKQSAAIYPWRQHPNFAASTSQAGKHGKPAVTACRHPFGDYSTSYWITLSCRTKIKKTLPVQTPPVQISHVKNPSYPPC